MNFYSQFLNFYLDCPLSYQDQLTPPTYLSMTIRDSNDPSRVLGILQLMNRTNGIRFTEQDVTHLGVLCSHLSQIFTYIFREGLLAQLS